VEYATAACTGAWIDADDSARALLIQGGSL